MGREQREGSDMVVASIGAELSLHTPRLYQNGSRSVLLFIHVWGVESAECRVAR